MAQRQGLLVGRHLSLAQAKASIILDWMERLDSAKRTVETELMQVKAALVASGDFRPEKLFKDYFPAPTGEENDGAGSLDVENEQGKLGVDYSEVEWKSGSEAIEEYEDLMRQISGLTSGSVSGTEFRPAAGPDEGWR